LKGSFSCSYEKKHLALRHIKLLYKTEKQMNMKKVSKTLAVALIALSAMYIKSMTKEQSAHELLLLNNIEALASGEDNNLDKADYYCYGRGNIDCPISGEKVNTVIKVYSLD
jgi:putative membrane protein